MSAMFMGGGYLAGALFFARASRATEWHRLGPGIVATTVFATLLGIATFVNWDQFNHGHGRSGPDCARRDHPAPAPGPYGETGSTTRQLPPGDVRVPRCRSPRRWPRA